MNVLSDSFSIIMESIAGKVPAMLGAVLVLLVGWVVAYIISTVVKRGLNKLKIEERLSGQLGEDVVPRLPGIGIVVGRIVFVVLMALVVVAFFQILGLTQATEPFNAMLNEIFLFLPRLFAAAIIIVVAWLIAAIVRVLVLKGLLAAKLDERLQTAADFEQTRPTSSQLLGNLAYWLVLLLSVPAVLSALDLSGLTAPVSGMMDKMLSYLPKLFGGVIILVIGLFAAKILRKIVTGVLTSLGTDKLGQKVGIGKSPGATGLSKLIGTIVYILIFLPVLVQALDAFQMDALTGPVRSVLATLLSTVPALLSAVLLLLLAYWVGRAVGNLVADLLAGAGFDGLMMKLGGPLSSAMDPAHRPASKFAGHLVMVLLILVAAVQALFVLGYAEMGQMLQDLMYYLGNVLIAVLIFAVGYYLSGLAAEALTSQKSKRGALLGFIARWAILVTAGAIALRKAGVADEIILIGYGAIFGTVAVGLAISFGIGGIKVASRTIEGWMESKSN